MIRYDVLICLFCFLSFLYYSFSTMKEGMETLSPLSLFNEEDKQLYELQKEDVWMNNKQTSLMLFYQIDEMSENLSKKMNRLLLSFDML